MDVCRRREIPILQRVSALVVPLHKTLAWLQRHCAFLDSFSSRRSSILQNVDRCAKRCHRDEDLARWWIRLDREGDIDYHTSTSLRLQISCPHDMSKLCHYHRFNYLRPLKSMLTSVGSMTPTSLTRPPSLRFDLNPRQRKYIV